VVLIEPRPVFATELLGREQWWDTESLSRIRSQTRRVCALALPAALRQMLGWSFLMVVAEAVTRSQNECIMPERSVRLDGALPLAIRAQPGHRIRAAEPWPPAEAELVGCYTLSDTMAVVSVFERLLRAVERLVDTRPCVAYARSSGAERAPVCIPGEHTRIPCAWRGDLAQIGPLSDTPAGHSPRTPTSAR